MGTDRSTARGGGPIFVVGSMGSGTTLLRLVLDSHPHIAVAQETGFMRAVLAHKWIPFWKFGGEWYKRLGWTEEELEHELGRFYDTIFGRFAREQGKQRWGDKSPYHSWHIEQAARVFPDAVFVATVRHPGAVTASVHNRFNYAMRRSTYHWLRVNLELVYQAARLGDRFVMCRYEDLVLEPEPTLRELMRVLDEPWSPNLLEHDQVHLHRGTPTEVEGRTRSDSPISAQHVATWTSQLSPADRAQLREQTSTFASFFGYDVDDAHALGGWPPGDGPWEKIATGSALADRMVAYMDRIDFDARPGPTPENQLLKPALRKRLSVSHARSVSARERVRARTRAATSRADPPSTERSAADELTRRARAILSRARRRIASSVRDGR